MIVFSNPHQKVNQNNKVIRQDEEKRISCTINMNFFTTTNLLQSNMEAGTFQSILRVCVCIIILVIIVVSSI